MVYAKRRRPKMRESSMATQPKPHEPPPPPPPHPPEPKPEAAKHEIKPEPPVETIADEQRARSEEIQKQGIDAWKAAHDERGPDEKPKVVPGVSHRAVDESELRGNSTPAARTAQHPAAPR